MSNIHSLVVNEVKRGATTREILTNLPGASRTPQITIEAILINLQLDGTLKGVGERNQNHLHPKYSIT